MERYGQILLLAMPIFLFFVLLEKWYGRRKGNDTVGNLDMISSLTSGITNVTKDVLQLSIAIISYSYIVTHFAVITIKETWFAYLLTFLYLDFVGYWVHRLSHKVNLFWNRHIIHHSSEEFNLACALRQSIASLFQLLTLFLFPMALIGMPENIIATVAPIHFFAQFWYHTMHINKMGFLEKIIVTPSHHRVHHAINPEYLDKNLGEIFILWDKWFGTFQQEIPEKPFVYGITRQAATWNPIKINFQHLWLLIKDAWRTNNVVDKFKIWFMPTGWRPVDVAAKYPIHQIDNVYVRKKYSTKTSNFFNVWVWFQLMSLLLLITYLFANIAKINSQNASYIYWYGAFIFLFVYALTDLMDANKYAWYWELLKFTIGIFCLLNCNGWFGIQQLNSALFFAIAAYLIISVITTFFIAKERGKTTEALFIQ